MELKIDIQPKKTYLYMRITGTYNLHKAKELFKDTVDAADKFGLYNILVDYREIKGSASTMQFYEYAKYVSELMDDRIYKKLPWLRFAYVGSSPFFDPSGFGETVAVNRGVMVIDTDNLETAMEWLQVESED